MKKALLLLTILLLPAALGCDFNSIFRKQVEIAMIPVYEDFIGYGANALPIKFYVTSNGQPMPNISVKYRVLPPEVGEVKSFNELTDEYGLDMAMFYMTNPITGPGQEVTIEAVVGRHTQQFKLPIIPYDRSGGGEMTILSDQGKNNLDEAEQKVREARLAYDLEDYYHCLLNLQIAETCLDYADTITDRDKESQLRREIARYRELVRVAAFPKDTRERVAQRVVLQGVLFETAKWEILPQFAERLRNAAAVIKRHPEIRIRIGGHTDSVPIRMGNYLLSVKRAQSVRDFLVEQGVDPDKLTIQGFGPDKPVADNLTEDGRQQNRRIEFEIIGPPQVLVF